MPTLDFDIAVGSDDARVKRTDTAYPPAGTITPNDAVGIEPFKGLNAGTYDITVGVLRWDTSSLPDAATLTSASLRIYRWGGGNPDSRDLTAEWYAYDGSIATTDYTDVVGTDALASYPLSNFTGIGLFTIPLDNTTGVSKTGYTGLRLHISGGQPTGENWVGIQAFEDTSQPNARLSVTYELPSVVPSQPPSPVRW